MLYPVSYTPPSFLFFCIIPFVCIACNLLHSLSRVLRIDHNSGKFICTDSFKPCIFIDLCLDSWEDMIFLSFFFVYLGTKYDLDYKSPNKSGQNFKSGEDMIAMYKELCEGIYTENKFIFYFFCLIYSKNSGKISYFHLKFLSRSSI